MSRTRDRSFKHWSITPKKAATPKTREELKADVEAWLAAGNKIKKLPSEQEWGRGADFRNW